MNTKMLWAGIGLVVLAACAPSANVQREIEEAARAAATEVPSNVREAAGTAAVAVGTAASAARGTAEAAGVPTTAAELGEKLGDLLTAAGSAVSAMNDAGTALTTARRQIDALEADRTKITDPAWREEMSKAIEGLRKGAADVDKTASELRGAVQLPRVQNGLLVLGNQLDEAATKLDEAMQAENADAVIAVGAEIDAAIDSVPIVRDLLRQESGGRSEELGTGQAPSDAAGGATAGTATQTP